MSNYDIVDLNYMTIYVEDHQAAINFYTAVFGPPEHIESSLNITGWDMGATKLTLFPAQFGTEPGRNPCNAEFAIQMASDAEVDRLFQALVTAGATSGNQPEHTEMYVPMYYSYVDDPFGIRIDIYCPQ